MNKINQLFASPLAERGAATPSLPGKLLSLYFCAGCPELDMTARTILTLQRRGISMIEVGIPFSDPRQNLTSYMAATGRGLLNLSTASSASQRCFSFTG